MDKSSHEEILNSSILGIKNFVALLLGLYNEFGIDGMHELVDPSLDDLEKLIQDMKKTLDILPHSEDYDIQSKKLNLSQGLLFAEVLINGVRRKDNEACSHSEQVLKVNQL